MSSGIYPRNLTKSSNMTSLRNDQVVNCLNSRHRNKNVNHHYRVNTGGSQPHIRNGSYLPLPRSGLNSPGSRNSSNGMTIPVNASFS